MAPVLLEPKPTEHYCPNCDVRAMVVVRVPAFVGEVTQEFHNCSGLAGMSAPLLPVGVKAKVEAREREDYVGGQLVQHDGEGRPIMAVVTTRDEGQDCAVMAPTAVVTMEGAAQ